MAIGGVVKSGGQAADANFNYLNSLFKSILGRELTIDDWNANWKNKTGEKDQWETYIRNSEEGKKAELNRYYEKYHGRPLTDQEWITNWKDKQGEFGNWEQYVASNPETKTADTGPASITAPTTSEGITGLQDLLGTYEGSGLSDKDYGLAYQGYLNAGFSKEDASKYALDDIRTTGEEFVKQQATEKQITNYVAQYPELAKQGIMSMDEALKQSAGGFFTKEMQPQIEASLNRRGLLDSGGLNVALSGGLENLTRQREAITQPMLAQANLTGQQQQYENLLRQAQQAGINLQTPSVFNQQFYQPNLGVYQNQLAQQAQQKQIEDQRAYNEAYQQRLLKQQQDSMLQSMLGSIGGNLIGGGIAGASGRNFMEGYTGQYFPQDYSSLYGGMGRTRTAGVGGYY